ncbi:hypothetical protein SeLEV6574_g05089 [Synchytrium endobioticum]|uniref:Uncharacterized protein n=1 Tax=Synchytrium endobioticum TaxID=286115 RepID=A0A507CW53_9FUNG|nr:hypothetical protein SeLEV6574_g05089 [Synchytrium endobioticum]
MRQILTAHYYFLTLNRLHVFTCASRDITAMRRAVGIPVVWCSGQRYTMSLLNSVPPRSALLIYVVRISKDILYSG